MQQNIKARCTDLSDLGVSKKDQKTAEQAYVTSLIKTFGSEGNVESAYREACDALEAAQKGIDADPGYPSGNRKLDAKMKPWADAQNRVWEFAFSMWGIKPEKHCAEFELKFAGKRVFEAIF